MPLIVICGLPCSGKTTRAVEIKSYFERKGKKVHMINEDTIGVQKKNEVYSNSINEKSVRASLKAAVERNISRNDITILDSLNYIKGYRYELHCVVKSQKTLHCILQTIVHKETCFDWNKQRDDSNRYSDEICKELVMRFEPPDSRNRWDSPLFSVKPEDDSPFQEIENALFSRKAPPPNQSTMNTPLSAVNFLYELDRITQEVIMNILEAQKTACIGDKIVIPNSTESIILLKLFNMAELRKLKKQFLTYTKMHPIENTNKIGNMFTQYINNAR